MRRFATVIVAALVFAVGPSGTATAGGTAPVRSGVNEMTDLAGRFTLESVGFAEKADIDKAVGYATIALDIAREVKDADMVMRIEKLLHAMRAVNMVQTADALEQKGRSVPELRALGCRMMREASPELKRMTEKYTGKSCEPI